MSPLCLLLAAQWAGLRNRFSRSAGKTLVTHLGAALAACTGAVGAGWLVVEPVLASMRAPAEGDVVTAGGPIVDAAFWIGVLGAAVLSFRVMENIYRTQDTRTLSTWPVPLGAQFTYRFLRSGAEVAVLFALSALFLTPLALQTGDPRALAGMGLVGGGLFLGLTVGFVVQLRAGVASFVRKGRTALDSGIGRMDAGGGTAAAFYMSPGAALVATLVGLLLLKLAVVDEFFARGATKLFWIGIAVPAAVSAVSVFLARRDFIRHYPVLLARFFEADLVQFDSGYDYHLSVTAGRRGVFERLVPASLLPLVRKDALQLGRRHPLHKLAVGALWIAVAIAIWGDRAAPLTLALLPVCFVSVVSAPWARLYGHELEPGMAATLPILAGRAHAAKLLVGLRDAFVAGAPCAILLVALGPAPQSLVAGAVALLAAPLAALVLTFLARVAGAGTSRLAGLVVCALLLPAL